MSDFSAGFTLRGTFIRYEMIMPEILNFAVSSENISDIFYFLDDLPYIANLARRRFFVFFRANSRAIFHNPMTTYQSDLFCYLSFYCAISCPQFLAVY